MNRNYFLFAAISLGIIGTIVYTWIFQDKAKCQRCNVVLISVDSLRPDHMGIYGAKRHSSPHLDRWSEGATVFTNFYSGATLTPISQAVIHTGKLSESNGLFDYQREIDKQVQTLPEFLHDKGYDTAGISTSPDFGVYPGIKASFQRGLDRFETLGKFEYPFFKAIDFLKNRKQKDRPFFLWMALSSVHWPYGTQVKNRFAEEKYDGVLKKFPDFPYAPAQNILFQLIFDKKLYPKSAKNNFWFWNFVTGKFEWPIAEKKKVIPLDETDLQFLRDHYDNNVADFDEKITLLLRELSSADFADNTVVILTTEHGEDLHEHGSFHHHDLWNTTVHIPLLWKSPVWKTGKRNNSLLSAADLFPSLVEHLGFKAPLGLDGQSIFQTNRKYAYFVRAPLWETVLNTEEKGNEFEKNRNRLLHHTPFDYGITDGRWKLIHRRSRLRAQEFSLREFVTGQKTNLEEYELYDSETDPLEQSSLVHSQPQKLEQLSSMLLKFEAEQYKKRPKGGVKFDFQEYF